MATFLAVSELRTFTPAWGAREQAGAGLVQGSKPSRHTRDSVGPAYSQLPVGRYMSKPAGLSGAGPKATRKRALGGKVCVQEQWTEALTNSQ